MEDRERTRYSDAELAEFKVIIEAKLKQAKKEYDMLMSNNIEGNGTDDTSPTFKALEEGAMTLTRDEVNRLAQRQKKFITHLEVALVRVENKTYGICRETGKLIEKERLKLVPHATLSMEAKKNRDR